MAFSSSFSLDDPAELTHVLRAIIPALIMWYPSSAMTALKLSLRGIVNGGRMDPIGLVFHLPLPKFNNEMQNPQILFFKFITDVIKVDFFHGV